MAGLVVHNSVSQPLIKAYRQILLLDRKRGVDISVFTQYIELTHGYVKDVKTRDEWIAIIQGWIDDIDAILSAEGQ